MATSSPTTSGPISNGPDSPGTRLVAMDVDGTLTDGTLTLAADGAEWKTFHARDGAGIKLLPALGITPAFISGRDSEAARRRAAELGIQHVHLAVGDKAACLQELCGKLGIDPAEAAFIGDDLSDIPPMRLAGWSAAPADAAPEVLATADFVSDAAGGHGAVRQAIEELLRLRGLWERVMDTYRHGSLEATP